MTAKADGFSYGYNHDNRLVAFTDTATPANNASYQYDSFGRRISKTVNGVKTFFVWDGISLLGEYTSAGVRSRRYAYLPNTFAPVQYEVAGEVYDVHVDHLQTPRFLTDKAQGQVWSQKQTAFGEMVVTGSVEFAVRFPGQYFDAETGLHYNYFRDYDSTLGRYIQSDPIGLEGGLNTYLYAFANPMRYIDPDGRTPVVIDPNTGRPIAPPSNPYTNSDLKLVIRQPEPPPPTPPGRPNCEVFFSACVAKCNKNKACKITLPDMLRSSCHNINYDTGVNYLERSV